MEIWYYNDDEQIAYTDIGPIPYNKLIVTDTDEPRRDSKDE